MQPSVEQRKHRRHSVRFDSIFSPDRVNIEEGLVVDLSLGGCRIKSARQFPPETSIELQIRPERDTSIYVSKAIVRWVTEGAFGVAFVELLNQEAATLNRLLWSLPASTSLP